MYFPSGFTILVGLMSESFGLCAEFNSASNPTRFERGHNGKMAEIHEILSFRTDFEVFPVRVPYTRWVNAGIIWVRCRIKLCTQLKSFWE
jgi:hypothetical protein